MANKTKPALPYMVTVFVKPKDNGNTKYGGKSYKGISIAHNPDQAKELATLAILRTFKDYDGSTADAPLINRDVIKVKSCILADAFVVKTDTFKGGE